MHWLSLEVLFKWNSLIAQSLREKVCFHRSSVFLVIQLFINLWLSIHHTQAGLRANNIVFPANVGNIATATPILLDFKGKQQYAEKVSDEKFCMYQWYMPTLIARNLVVHSNAFSANITGYFSTECNTQGQQKTSFKFLQKLESLTLTELILIESITTTKKVEDC